MAINETRQVIHRKIFLFLLYAIMFAIPIYGRLLPTLIILLTLNWLIEGAYIDTIKLMSKERTRFLTISFAFLYLLYVAGLVHTINFQYAMEDLEIKLSLLLFPLIFATSRFPLLNKEEVGNALRAFGAGCILSSVMMLVRAWHQTVVVTQPDAFYYALLSWTFHPSYFSMYLNFAMSNILYFLLVRRSVTGSRAVAGHTLILLLFTIMIVLLSSKAGLLAWLIITGFYTTILIIVYKRRLTGLLFGAVSVAVFLLLLQIFPHAITRVSQARQDMTSKSSMEDPKQSTGERVAVWKAAAEIIRKNALFGVGTGDVKDALLERYKENDLVKILRDRLNAHNQYLQTFITLGITGFLALIIMLVFPALKALRSKNYIYLIFLAIFAINILFESMLEVQAGVVFYALVNIVLFTSGRSDPSGNPFDIPVTHV
ncbi:MAG: O-antigen ligase family protein [Bacteroidales bacterium]